MERRRLAGMKPAFCFHHKKNFSSLTPTLRELRTGVFCVSLRHLQTNKTYINI